ncbi:flagellar basal-body rod protein FlgC [Rhodovulum bhavnagarense]|uniref:Flagellar basal-body rod protein FlgC n=1 Tax=Rhodovulum bhavnagarense TaxID=992286 RepID=A0A4R2RNH9_9RHOB|nr:flagellar basal body rod protein FlgC [Rhodovulum bhavnagarense]TCP61351.1 flagellar basal-body rod protein FlgC [Rhodovulum bhavnagarense]
MSDIQNLFDVAGRAMSAQMTRLNTVASNLANADSVSTNAEGAYRPMRPVFAAVYADRIDDPGLAGVDVTEIAALPRTPARVYRPDHPSADQEGFVYQSTVNPDEEMVEMLEASRQYQNNLEVVSTVRELMARTVSMGR